jgi:hypothetical protein
MPRSPDSTDGPLYEEAIFWEEQASDPVEDKQTQFVQGKGLVTLADGAVRPIGETREASWQHPVEQQDVNTPPGGPSAGYRVIVGSSPTGDFIGHEGEIAQYNGSSWVFSTPKQGTVVYVNDSGVPYNQNSLSSPWSWSQLPGSLPPATDEGQLLYSHNGTTFEITRPIVNDDGFILTNDDGDMVVE